MEVLENSARVGNYLDSGSIPKLWIPKENKCEIKFLGLVRSNSITNELNPPQLDHYMITAQLAVFIIRFDTIIIRLI